MWDHECSSSHQVQLQFFSFHWRLVSVSSRVHHLCCPRVDEIIFPVSTLQTRKKKPWFQTHSSLWRPLVVKPPHNNQTHQSCEFTNAMQQLPFHSNNDGQRYESISYVSLYQRVITTASGFKYSKEGEAVCVWYRVGCQKVKKQRWIVLERALLSHSYQTISSFFYDTHKKRLSALSKLTSWDFKLMRLMKTACFPDIVKHWLSSQQGYKHLVILQNMI